MKKKNKEIKQKIQSDLNASLISAVELGFSGNVRRLLKKGANSNSIDETGKTVLYIAASKGDAKVVHLLLKKGAKNNFSNCITPLDIAVILEHLEIIQLLVKEDRDIDLNQNKHNKGVTNPLSLAIFHKKLGSVRLLLESGAEVLTKHIPQNTKCNVTFEIIKILIPYLLLGDSSLPKLECIKQYHELLLIWEDSLSQIKKMQNKFISEVYTYYDLLKIDSNKLLKGITIDNFIESKNINFNENFSSYSALLDKKIKELIFLKENQNESIASENNITFFKNMSASASILKKYPCPELNLAETEFKT